MDSILDQVIHIVSWVLLVGGGLAGIIGGIGLLRMPDFFTRCHAAGITDTLCAGAVLIGLMFQAGWTLATAKLVLIMFFLFFTSPTATYALAHAAVQSGLKPVRGADHQEDASSKT